MKHSIDVLGKTYTISVLTNDNLGECDYVHQSIGINIGLAGDAKLETLLHECIHAVSGDMGLGLHEKQVRPLSVGLYQVLKANPTIWTRMWRNDKA